MNARSVERAGAQLHALRLEGVESLLLGGLALAAAIVGSRLLPELALPLLLGGLAVAFLGLRALVRRFLLLEDLALDRDAYLIPEVRAVALRAASPAHRLQMATAIRGALGPSCQANPRIEGNRDVLVELEAALRDETLALDAAAAVALDRLLASGEDSLSSQTLPIDELRSRLHRILDAFAPSSR